MVALFGQTCSIRTSLRLHIGQTSKTEIDMQKIMFNDRYGLTDAVLRGSKTQTRRLMKPNGVIAFRGLGYTRYEITGEHLRAWNDDKKEFIVDKLPYKVGEVVAIAQCYEAIFGRIGRDLSLMDEAGFFNKMFVKAELMPHHIRITGIRVQRLQDISDEDCIKEGIENVPAGGGIKPYTFYDTKIHIKNDKEDGYGWYVDFDTPREAYAALIDRVAGKGTWASNPFVVAYKFELID